MMDIDPVVDEDSLRSLPNYPNDIVHIFYFKLQKRNKTGITMNSCYIVDLIARDHTYTNITT